MFCLCLSAQRVIRHSQTFHRLRATTTIKQFQLPDGRQLKSRHHQNDFISSSVCRRHSRTYVSSVEWSGWTSPLIYTSLYLAHYAAFFYKARNVHVNVYDAKHYSVVIYAIFYRLDHHDTTTTTTTTTITLGVFGTGPRCRPMATSAPWRPPLANPNPFP